MTTALKIESTDYDPEPRDRLKSWLDKHLAKGYGADLAYEVFNKIVEKLPSVSIPGALLTSEGNAQLVWSLQNYYAEITFERGGTYWFARNRVSGVSEGGEYILNSDSLNKLLPWLEQLSKE